MGNKKTIIVCQGTGCVSSGSIPTYHALEQEIRNAGLTQVKMKLTGCHGFCQRGPIVIVEPDGIFYAEVQEKDCDEIVSAHLVNGQPVERLFYTDPVTGEAIAKYEQIPFYANQERIILARCGHINPEAIEDSLDSGVYSAAPKVLREMNPDEVISEIRRSGLRGRGGAGFPTAVKWGFCAKVEAYQKYIICNADEGDPGAFMDRSILEATPHQVIEGMIIAGYAIGATKGYIYARAEYPLAIRRLGIAIHQAREKGFLGKGVFDSTFDFDITIFHGAGAFVCGEETALIGSIEGGRGMPRTRPPFPAVKGLWGKPTIINNVKSLATVPEIMTRGADWFTGIGTDKSPGTAVFALTGKVANCGLIEVPMGTPLRKIIFDIGGGIIEGGKFKAVQTGGPSGGCLPEEFLDTPVDFENLAAAGSIMGSGGMVVMDETTCMVDVARYFLDFTRKESCGKCTPCRMGTKHMLEILEDICEGRGEPDDLPKLLELAEAIKEGSLCGLGQTAPNPVITTIKYFRHEYEAHVYEKRCPALKCKSMLLYHVDEEACKRCGTCKKNCPAEAITGDKKEGIPFEIHLDRCIQCGMCHTVCPVDAVIKTSPGTKTNDKKAAEA
ncbi:MAG: NADH-quinone oxidoreductase subunit NuoF [Deltaproteobacteria bacterium]|nr:NADH-quinone oxidoreductase subunit NuoF [Deltaproteobacteria bacterium]